MNLSRTLEWTFNSFAFSFILQRVDVIVKVTAIAAPFLRIHAFSVAPSVLSLLIQFLHSSANSCSRHASRIPETCYLTMQLKTIYYFMALVSCGTLCYNMWCILSCPQESSSQTVITQPTSRYVAKSPSSALPESDSPSSPSGSSSSPTSC